jgi:hypothetical protein
MAQRYTPGYNSRDRSPPPQRPSDRYDGPRAPRGSLDSFRGRGRGYGGRGDFRPDPRDRDILRDGRQSPPPFGNDRATDSRVGPNWRDDRDFDRRRSPPPSGRGRGGPPDFRDYRDREGPPPLPRDDISNRGRGGFGRGGPPFREPGLPPRGRGGFPPRGRGTWDDRGRRRESIVDDRPPFRPRSRSPPPPRSDHWERPPLRDQREPPPRHDEWRPPPRRDDDRGLEHGEINDRFRNDRPPSAMGSRRTSVPNSNSRPATPHGPALLTSQSTSAPRPGVAQEREQNTLRRATTSNMPAPVRDLRRDIQRPEYPASRIEASRGRYTSGPSSPVQPPQVPAYGAMPSRKFSGQVPAEGPQWNMFQAQPAAAANARSGHASPFPARTRPPPRSPSPALAPVQDSATTNQPRPTNQPMQQRMPATTTTVERINKPDAEPRAPVRRPSPVRAPQVTDHKPSQPTSGVGKQAIDNKPIQPMPTVGKSEAKPNVVATNTQTQEAAKPFNLKRPDTSTQPIPVVTDSGPHDAHRQDVPPEVPSQPRQQAPPPPQSQPQAMAPSSTRIPPTAPRSDVEKQVTKGLELERQVSKGSDLDKTVPRGPKAERMQDSRSSFERRAQPFLVPPRDLNRTDNPLSPIARPMLLNIPVTKNEPPSQQVQGQTSQPTTVKSPPLGPRQHPGFSSGSDRVSRTEIPPSAPQSMRASISSVATSPQPSPTFLAPFPPRGPQPVPFTSPNPANNSIPTGPRAGRGASQPPVRPAVAPTGPGGPNWQWNRQGFQGPQMKPNSTIPAKRDAHGEEKSSGVQNGFVRADTGASNELVRRPAPVSPMIPPQGRAQSFGDHGNNMYKRSLPRRESPRPVERSKSPPRPLSPAFPSAPLSPAFPTEDGDEDAMMLDDQDIEKNEAEFQKKKAELEAKQVDPGSRYYRGASPLEKLAYLSRMTISEVVVGADGMLSPPPDPVEEAMQHVQQGQLLTPKTEEVGDDTVMHSDNEASTPQLGTPELNPLPFLRSGPMTPLSEKDVVQDNLRHQDAVRMLLQAELKRQNLDRLKTEEEVREEYATLYRPWRKYVDELDMNKNDEGGPVQPIGGMTAVASAALDPLAAAAVVNENRRSRAAANATDYDMDRALQQSLETAAIEETKRKQEA